jgi:hypothetical protein
MDPIPFRLRSIAWIWTLVLPVAAAEPPARGDPPAGAPADAPGSAAKEAAPAPPLPWLDEVLRPPSKIPPDAPRLAPLLADAEGNAIATAEAWRAQRSRIRDRWIDFLGKFPEERGPVALSILEEDHPRGCIRKLVRYEAEPGLPVEGYLLLPEKIEGRLPGVVVLHSTADCTIRQPAGLEGPASHHLALDLARRGFVAFAPRCFLWQYRDRDIGDAVTWLAKHRPGVKGMAKMLHDARRAVDVLESLPFVDPGRLGCIGHSLGGKEALYLAAFDERIRAAVSSEGGVGLAFSNWEAPWYLGSSIRIPRFPLENHQVLALVTPRAFLLIGGGDADGARSWPFIEAVLPIYDILGVPRRAGLFDHGKGHAVPPEAKERAYAWLEHFLAPPPPGPPPAAAPPPGGKAVPPGETGK